MLLKARKKQIHVGPEDDGRRMSLDDFDEAIAQEGYIYELNKGVIEVSGIPPPGHLAQLQQVRNQLIVHQMSHEDIIHTVAGSNESKILLDTAQSERHPDISVYFSGPPETKDVWSLWIPQIVVEIVSKRSIKRDYEDKPPEYLAFGVDEYWIVDSFKNQMTALTRWRGQWKEKIIKPTQKYSTLRLPGFSLDLKRAFTAGK